MKINIRNKDKHIIDLLSECLINIEDSETQDNLKAKQQYKDAMISHVRTFLNSIQYIED